MLLRRYRGHFGDDGRCSMIERNRLKANRLMADAGRLEKLFYEMCRPVIAASEVIDERLSFAFSIGFGQPVKLEFESRQRRPKLMGGIVREPPFRCQGVFQLGKQLIDRLTER